MMRPMSLNRPLPPLPCNDVILVPKAIASLSGPFFADPVAQCPLTENPKTNILFIPSGGDIVGSVQMSLRQTAPVQPQSSQKQKPRPRVPRMGVSMQPKSGTTLLQQSRASICSPSMILGQPNAERKYPAQGTPNLAFETASLSEEVCPNKHTPVNSKENATKLELIGHERKPTSLNFLSSARNGSITMSQDFRKFFRRPSNFPNSHRMSAMPESMQKRPAPNHGNQGRSRSTSSCDYSQDTETTSLSLTWPMSRSQHDVSNQVYRSVSNLLANDPSAESQYFGMSVEPTTAAPDLRQLQGSNSSGTADKENDSSTLSPTLTEQMTGAWTNSSAEEWLRMVDTEDMLRRLKRMRIISLTAKQWKIKRRPDGTRYLACRKSHETKCGPNPASKHDPTGNQKTSPQEDACQVQTNQQTERDSLENVNGNQRSLLEQPQSRRCKQKRSKCQSPNEISPRLSINTDQNVILNMNGTHSARRQSRKRDSVKLTSIVHRDDEDVTAAVNRPRLSVHEDRHRRASSQTIFNVRQTNTSTQRSYTAGRLSMMRNSGLANPNHPNQVLRDIHLFSNCSTYTTRSSDSSATTGSTKLVTMLVV